jgi:hypothetical protein
MCHLGAKLYFLFVVEHDVGLVANGMGALQQTHSFDAERHVLGAQLDLDATDEQENGEKPNGPEER